MAAVYSSLLSLIKVINRTENPPLLFAFLKKLQTQHLLDQVLFLLEFVEDFSHYTKRSQEIELLDIRIVTAARKAEDIIETFVIDQIKRKTAESSTTIDSIYAISCKNLEKVVQDINLITEEVFKIQADYKEKNHQQQQQKVKHSIQAASGGKKNTNAMVGFDEDLTKLMEKLTSPYESGRLVIPITGMGGIGKTTLATNTYNHPSILRHFDIRAWVTISQNFSLRNTLLCLLYDTGLFKRTHENLDAFTNDMRNMSDGELGVKLHKALFERKYLVVLDDIWSIRVPALSDSSESLPVFLISQICVFTELRF